MPQDEWPTLEAQRAIIESDFDPSGPYGDRRQVYPRYECWKDMASRCAPDVSSRSPGVMKSQMLGLSGACPPVHRSSS